MTGTTIRDSALDLNYKIEHLDINQKKMRVRYYTGDSDTERPDIMRLVDLPPSDVSSEGIHRLAKREVVSVYYKWQQIRQNSLIHSGFNADSYLDIEFNAKFKPHRVDSYPNEPNPLLAQIESYDSEGEDEIRTKFRYVYLDSAAREQYANGLEFDPLKLRQKLSDLGRLDSAQDLFDFESGSESQSVRTVWEYGDALYLNDSLGLRLQVFLGLNDSAYQQFALDLRDEEIQANLNQP